MSSTGSVNKRTSTRTTRRNRASTTSQSSRQSSHAAVAAAIAENGVEDDQCIICLDKVTQPKKLGCGHTFCTACIAEYFRRCQEKCPTCGKVFGVLRGNQPPGRFNKSVIQMSLPGYERCKTIQITYTIPDGVQTVSFICCSFLLCYISYCNGQIVCVSVSVIPLQHLPSLLHRGGQ